MNHSVRHDVLEEPNGNEIVLNELIRFHTLLEQEAQAQLSQGQAGLFVCQLKTCSIEFSNHILFSRHYAPAEMDHPLRITIYSPTVSKDNLSIGEDKLPRGFLSGRSIQMSKNYSLYRSNGTQPPAWAEPGDDAEDWSSSSLAKFWVLSLQAICFR